jgi:hypothetical protein
LSIEILECRTLMSVTPLGGFPGLAFDLNVGATPPDTIAAVGPTEVGEAVNTSLEFFNKSGGTLFQGSFDTLFSSVRVDAFDATLLSDPSIHYDAANGRFVISLLDLDMSTNQAYLDFAISTNNHPAQGSDFLAGQITITESAASGSPNPGSTLWSDFDRYGSSANAYVFTFNMFTFPIGTQSLFDHVQVLAVDKSAILSSTPSLLIHTVDLPGWDGSKIVNENVAPVDMHGAQATDPMYFVEETSYGSATSSQLRLLKVANVLNASAGDFQSVDITVPSYTSNPLIDPAHPWNSGDANANAPQMGSADQMQTNDTRMLSAAWRRDSQGVQHLVVSQTVGATLARARWYDFITSSPMPTLNQSGEVGNSGAASYYPSVDITPNGNIGMNFIESSASETVSMYVTARTASDPPNSMQPPILAKAGEAGYSLLGLESSPHRGGDFSGIGGDIDSSGNPLNSFWAANEYTGSNGAWATWLSNFSVTSVTGPAGASVLSSSPSGSLNPPVNSLLFTFSEPMNTSSFSVAGGVDSFNGPAGNLLAQITGFSWVDSTHLQVNFNSQSASGVYTMVIGPNILRASDNHPLDQNGNGTAGEIPGDEYTASFTLNAPPAPQLIEGFETPDVYHLVFPPSTAQASTLAAHDGKYGLIMHNGPDFIYRDDPAALVQEGETISAWVQLNGAADGRAYFLFGANSNSDGSPLASYSLVLSAGSRQMLFQENFFAYSLNSTIGTPVTQKYQANHWYRIEVSWATDGSMTGRLYDSNGTSLLNTVHASATLFSSGGIGFKGTGHDKYFDTVTVVSGTHPQIARVLDTYHRPMHGKMILLDGRPPSGRDRFRHEGDRLALYNPFAFGASPSLPSAKGFWTDSPYPSGQDNSGSIIRSLPLIPVPSADLSQAFESRAEYGLSNEPGVDRSPSAAVNHLFETASIDADLGWLRE